MAKNVLTVRDLGEETCWLLVQQAKGIPDATMCTDFLSEKVAVLFFGMPSLPERLCVSAAVRQMGGSVVYEVDNSSEGWRREIREHQAHLMPIFNFYLDVLYLYGIPTSALKQKDVEVDFPVINAGSPDAHPAHALADIACMIKSERYLNSFSAAWLGSPNGTLYSLVAATDWFPFSLRIALPEGADTTTLRSVIGENSKVEMVKGIEEAVRDVKFIIAGSRAGLDYPAIKEWEITPKVLRHADPNASIFLGARPINCLPIVQEVLHDRSRLLLQSEYRLRMHKRILHWVFNL